MPAGQAPSTPSFRLNAGVLCKGVCHHAMVTLVYACNRKWRPHRSNKVLSNFLAPPQCLLIYLHQSLRREKWCSLKPIEENMENPETTSVFNTGESTVPSPAQILFSPPFYFSSDDVSSHVILALIPGSFDAL